MRLSGFILLPLLFISPYISGCENDDESYPYLFEIVQSYYSDNFEYPVTVDNIIEYWNLHKPFARKELYGEKTVEWIQKNTFDRLQKHKKFIEFAIQDSLYIITDKKSIIYEYPLNYPCDYDYVSSDRWNLRPFLRVVMHTDASPYNNIASEETTGQFNQGLYNIIATHFPEFKTHLKDRNIFNVALLYSEKGKLQKFCQNEQLDMNTDIMKSIASYVDEYMTQNCLSKIFFYYIYY